ELLQSAHLDQLLHLQAAVVESAEHRQALPYGEEVLQRGLLEEDAGLFTELPAQRLSAVAHFPGGCAENPLHDLDGGGLAGAVGAGARSTCPRARGKRRRSPP